MIQGFRGLFCCSDENICKKRQNTTFLLEKRKTYCAIIEKIACRSNARISGDGDSGIYRQNGNSWNQQKKFDIPGLITYNKRICITAFAKKSEAYDGYEGKSER